MTICYASGHELAFTPGADGERVAVEVRDTGGNVLETLSIADALDARRRQAAAVGSVRCPAHPSAPLAGSPINITGLSSGLDTNSIITALLNAERIPITQLTHQQEKLQGQASALASMQSSMRALSFAAFEFRLGTLFENSQAVSSSEPLRVSAATTTGAGVGGYEVEVSQLANSAQRTFTFTPPAGEDTVTIDGGEYTLKAGSERQRTREQDQRRRQSDRLRGRAGQRNDRLLESHDRRDGR